MSGICLDKTPGIHILLTKLRSSKIKAIKIKEKE